MRKHGRARKHLVAGAYFDHVAQSIEGARKDRGHQPVLARQRGDGLEGAARASQVRLLGIAIERVELHQCHGGDRILRERLDVLAQAAELVGAGVVEITAELEIAIPIVEVPGDVAGLRQPVPRQPRLVCPHRGPQPPGLVGQLAIDALPVGEACARPVAIGEQTLKQRARVLAQRGSLTPTSCIQVRDPERRIPGRVDAAVDVRGGSAGPAFSVQ